MAALCYLALRNSNIFQPLRKPFGNACSMRLLLVDLQFFGSSVDLTFRQQLAQAYKDFRSWCRMNKVACSQPMFNEFTDFRSHLCFLVLEALRYLNIVFDPKRLETEPGNCSLNMSP